MTLFKLFLKLIYHFIRLSFLVGAGCYVFFGILEMIFNIKYINLFTSLECGVLLSIFLIVTHKLKGKI